MESEKRGARTLRKFAEGAIVLLVLSIALLSAICIYLLPPLWNKNFGLFDNRYFYGPNAYFLDTSLNNGELPLWNPLIYAGTPFAADPQSSIFYPPHLLRSLLTPAFDPYATALSIELTLVLHLLLGAMGVYVLAREYRCSPPAGIAGAMVFMLGPFSVIYATEFYIFPLVMAWAPWILWFARRALQAPSIRVTLFYTAWTALAFGISTLAFFPQLSLYMGLMLFFYVALDRLARFTWSFNRASLRPALRSTGRGVFLLAAVATTGGLLAAVALLPAAEFSGFSARTVIAGLVVEPWEQNLGWVHLLKCLVVFPGNTWLPQGCRAAGIGSLLAVIASFTHKNKRDVFVFFGMFVLMTDLTLGPPFPASRLLNAVDFLNITISPWRAGIFSGLCLAMVVALGVDAASQASQNWRRAFARTAILVASGSGMILLLVQWLDDAPLFTPVFPAWVLPVVTVLAMSVFVWIKRPKLAKATIGVLVVAEIFAWSVQMLPEYASRRFDGRPHADLSPARNLWQDNYRTTTPNPNWNMWTLDAATNGYDAIYVGRTRQILCAPRLENEYRAMMRDYEVQADNLRGNLFLKRSFWLARQWVSGALPAKNQLYPAATTVFLPEIETGTVLPVGETLRSDVEELGVSQDAERIDLGDEATLRRGARKAGKDPASITLPECRIDFTHGVLYVGYTATGVEDINALCTDENGKTHAMYRRRTMKTGDEEKVLAFPLPDCATATVTLQWSKSPYKNIKLTQAYVLKDKADENAHIRILKRRANSVDLELKDLPAPRILTFVDSAYPGWHAEVDGKEQPLLLANDGFKAIVVPDGTHEVRFWFESPTATIGLWISLATLSFVTLLIGLTAWPARRMPHPETGSRDGNNDGSFPITSTGMNEKDRCC